MEYFDDTANDACATLKAGQLLALAQQTPQTVEPGGLPFVLKDGVAISLEKMLNAPLRHRAHVLLRDVASFNAYVTRFKETGSLIFAKCDLKGGEFVAHLDHETVGGTSWNEHRATLQLVPTSDWLAWTNTSGKFIPQDAFCEFVEKYRHVFREPTAADMLEISRNIEAKRTGSFKSGVRLPNGDRTLLWEEETKATAGATKLEIPEEITIVLTPFEGGEPVAVRLFLRYRIANGVITFAFELQQPEKVIRHAVNGALDSITTATGLLVLSGQLVSGN